ncbi:glycosyltransferase family A protein [Mucilaginibacter sp. PPCGB 2223]|uniref:glycosyltransferase family 2 protein n=1 Tax=Mucilaginibacter sp. PPCGB 2223 TaxID=1886027 RepID=UPI00111258A2|nr:glycosyltransferase family A protein [Mucilaginibacter sp. PPCGB 2223]
MLYSHLLKPERYPYSMDVTQPAILSVIIPTKNRPYLLVRALQSVVKQTYRHFEVCVVDNNTDEQNSLQVKQTVAEFELQYADINWIYIHSNKKFASGARNDGMAATIGNLIFFLDDDDELLADSLSIRVDEMLADPELALLYCAGYSKIYPYPFKMYRYYHYNKKLHTEKLMMMSCSSIAINRSIFKENDLYFDEAQSRMDDYDLCRRVIELDLKVKSIPGPLVMINLHPDTRISSHKLVDYTFKDVLIERWGESAADTVYHYAEGVYIWRLCFGTADQPYKEIIAGLRRDFNREPTPSFKFKYALAYFSPKLFLALYHIGVAISQTRKNRLARKL